MITFWHSLKENLIQPSGTPKSEISSDLRNRYYINPLHIVFQIINGLYSHFIQPFLLFPVTLTTKGITFHNSSSRHISSQRYRTKEKFLAIEFTHQSTNGSSDMTET
jgi:hypothetical protein